MTVQTDKRTLALSIVPGREVQGKVTSFHPKHHWSLSSFLEHLQAQPTLRMLVLVNKNELQVLKKELRSCFPESLKKVPSEMNYFTQSCAVFYKDLDAYEKLVEDSDAIDWKQEFLLQGLQDGVYQTSQNLAAAKHFSAKLVTRTQVFVVQKPLNLSSSTPTSGSELKLSSLNTTHAPLLNETWSVGGNELSLCYLTQLIDCFPSSCLLDAGGCPISWVLLDQFGCLTHAYTMPAHRGKGYIQLVIAALGRKLQSLNYPVYGDVLENNTSMQRALQCLEANFTSCFLSYDLHTPISLL
ncbi:glycine N-acyltransferase-like protein 3 isoform X2 [Lacerta agilis]|uniref:glycine N-acyltransferase-like protein 3 isoform X2 n=1 Tax=Lacerta agilis TaxID=80427 RepID=UPI0014195B41|nr:glycine N-acyltransferase-like protein 3 isoform X2 [Lacerta agilis]